MRLALLLMLTMGLTAGAESPSTDEKLRQELLGRMQADQEARKAVLSLMQQSKKPESEETKKADPPALKRMKEIDRQNTDRMREIVRQYGWPGKSLVGADGAQAAWMLVQHADHDRPFQKNCLGLLAAAFKQGEATGEQLAYLTDRVRIGEKQQQVYGTQFREVEGKLQPEPIEDEENVDRRRQEMGLLPLADYLTFAQFVKGLSRSNPAGPKPAP